MHEIKALKEKLCKELKSYNDKELNTTTLASIDTLAHAIKNINKIIEAYEDEEASYGMMYDNRIMPRSAGSYGSYGMSRNRDSMGRYSRNGYSRGGEDIQDLQAEITNLQNRLHAMQGM